MDIREVLGSAGGNLGWNEDTKVEFILDFIESKGLVDELQLFLLRREADERKEMEGNDG